MATKQKHQKQQLSLNLNFETTPTEQVSKHRLLGVTVDKQLMWQTHINNICRTVSRNMFLFSKLSQTVSHKAKQAPFLAHIMTHINQVSNAWDVCACVHMKQLYSLHKRAIKFLMPSPNVMDYNQKCCALKLLPLDKQLLLNKCVLMQKVVHGTDPQYLKDLMISSQRLHVHGNNNSCPEQGLISLKRVSPFWAVQSGIVYLIISDTPWKLKQFKRKHFTHSLSYLDTVVVGFFLILFARHLDTKCIVFSPLACCQVLHLYFTIIKKGSTLSIFIFMR